MLTIELIPAATDFSAASFQGAMTFKVVNPATSNQSCAVEAPAPEATPQTVCGGNINLDLSADTEVSFVWQAPPGKEIRIDGPSRSRVEFQATVPCGPSNFSDEAFKYQEIPGTSFTPVVDGSSTSALSYNANASFVMMGKCAGCSECEVYTRIQYDAPVTDARLRKLVWTVPYDNKNTLTGPQTYRYGTDLYCWIRGANPNRRLGQELAQSRQLAAVNTFSLVDDGATNKVTNRASVFMVSPVIFLLAVLQLGGDR